MSSVGLNTSPVFASPQKKDPEAPAIEIRTPETHFAKYFEENVKGNGEPNRNLRRLERSLARKQLHCVAIGSAEKDIELMRKRCLRPNADGIIEVKCRRRLWQTHNDGRKQERPFPVRGENILELTGPQVRKCSIEYRRQPEPKLTFVEFLKQYYKKE